MTFNFFFQKFIIFMNKLFFLNFQLHPGYVVCSFVFLLLGLASLSSSINLLVLRFMILSLEEDEEEIYDLQDVTQNVITLGKNYI